MNYGIFFDLDGTLVDTAGDLILACNETLKKWHLEPIDAKTLRPFTGLGIKAMLSLRISDDLAKTYPRDTLMREFFLDFYNKNICKKSAVFPGGLELLDTLKEKDFNLAVVTGKYHALALSVLEKLHILDYFDAIIGSDDCTYTKPHPESLNLCKDKLKLKFQNCLYIGDHINDIKAAQNAQMKSAAALWGYGLKERDVLDFKDTIILKKPIDLLNFLDTIF